MIVDTFK